MVLTFIHKHRHQIYMFSERFFLTIVPLILILIIINQYMTNQSEFPKTGHKVFRQTINHQLELFYFNTGIHPSSMTPKAWSYSSKDIHWSIYFPDNVPAYCNQGSRWLIDPVTHEISLANHSDHE